MNMLTVLAFVVLTSAQASAPSADLTIWREFSALVQRGPFPRDRVRPLVPGMEETLVGFLSKLPREPAAWARVPEVVRIGPQINFIIPFGDETRPFNFVFIEEDGRWYFRHLEQVMLRLDKTPPPPTSTFPDTSEERKAWARDEIYWSQIVRFQAVLAPMIGRTAFLDLLRDGRGYSVAAQSWVPFLPAHRAFILYLCWDLAQLHGMNTRGESVTLESLDDQVAVVRLRDPPFFRLYQVASHIRPQISYADYREIFETIWKDRAQAAGWTLTMDYLSPDGLDIVFRFSRSWVR